MAGKPISKSKNPGLVKLAAKKPELAKKFGYNPKRVVAKKGGMVDKRSPFMGGGIAYAGGGKAMKRSMYSKGTEPRIKHGGKAKKIRFQKLNLLREQQRRMKPTRVKNGE
tara:strand:- start:78 stop:407 length:330 start_codon:yes stop_codon:yes gene_type:complete